MDRNSWRILETTSVLKAIPFISAQLCLARRAQRLKFPRCARASPANTNPNPNPNPGPLAQQFARAQEGQHVASTIRGV